MSTESVSRYLTYQPRGSLNSRFLCHTSKKIIALLVALVLGMALSSLFTWDDPPEYSEISALSIFLHNRGLGAISVLMGPYIAGSFYIFNAVYLGFALMASVKIVGLVDTLRLTVMHVPLEMGAWVACWTGATCFSFYMKEVFQSELDLRLSSRRLLIRTSLLALVLMGLAALAEWFELHLFLS